MEESVETIMSMGFPREKAMEALKSSDYDVQKAIEFIFSMNSADEDLAKATQASFDAEAESKDVEVLAVEHVESTDGTSPSRSGQVSHTSTGNFGPASRSSYENSQWEVVPFNPPPKRHSSRNFNASSVGLGHSYSNLGPRSKNEPPVLLATEESGSIAPLLVILHNIPHIRKLILEKNLVDSIGFDPDWWRGELASPVPGLGKYNGKRMTIETQRLVAFLDGESQRPFATLELFSRFGIARSVTEQFKGSRSIGTFMEELARYSGEGSALHKALVSRAVEAKAEVTNNISDFTDLEGRVCVSIGETFYDVVNELLWPDATVAPENYLSHVGDVLSISLKRDDGQNGTGIDIPSKFYPTRYTQEFLPLQCRIRERRSKLLKEQQSLQQKKMHLFSYSGQDVGNLLNVTAQHLQSLDTPEGSAAFRELQDAKNGLAAAKQALVEMQSSIRDKVHALKNCLQSGSLDPEELEIYDGLDVPSMVPYHLVGAVLSPHTYYYKVLAGAYEGDWFRVDGTSVRLVCEGEALKDIKDGEGNTYDHPVSLIFTKNVGPAEPFELPKSLAQFKKLDCESAKSYFQQQREDRDNNLTRQKQQIDERDRLIAQHLGEEPVGEPGKDKYFIELSDDSTRKLQEPSSVRGGAARAPHEVPKDSEQPLSVAQGNSDASERATEGGDHVEEIE